MIRVIIVLKEYILRLTKWAKSKYSLYSKNKRNKSIDDEVVSKVMSL